MIWIVLSIAVWGIIHSILASAKFKGLLRSMIGDQLMVAYRFAYNVFSLLTFAPIYLLVRILPDRNLYILPAPWMYLMLAGQGLSALLLLYSFLQTGPLSFVGLSQFWEGERPSELVTGGMYRVVRHPLYLFSLLFLWLSPVMTLNQLVFYISATAYIFIGAYFEERKLLREFGVGYAEYKSVTPMMIPGLVFKRNK
jgi:methanethiol S-methyltransferase